MDNKLTPDEESMLPIRSIVRRRLFSYTMRNSAQTAQLVIANALPKEKTPNIQKVIRKKRRKRVIIKGGVRTWMEDYLSTDYGISETEFRATFGIPRAMFQKLHDDLLQHCPFVWATRRNAARVRGVLSQVKVMTCLRILCAGSANNDKDLVTCIGAETARVYFKTFCKHVVEVYGSKYLNQRPTQDELQLIERNYSKLGIPGCVGAISSGHIEWKNCPFRRRVQHVKPTKAKVAPIPMEIWCDKELYIWNSTFGDREKNANKNDPTLSSKVSLLFKKDLDKLFHSTKPSVDKATPQETGRLHTSVVAYGEDPKCSFFVGPFPKPTNAAEPEIQAKLEQLMGDCGKVIAVLKSRFAFLRKPTCLWFMDDIIFGCKACVILHNVLVRMQQNGSFREDEKEYPDGINLVTECFENEQANQNNDDSVEVRAQVE